MERQHGERPSRRTVATATETERLEPVRSALTDVASLGVRYAVSFIKFDTDSITASVRRWDERTAALVFVIVSVSALAAVPVAVDVGAAQSGTNGTGNETPLTAGANIDDQTITPDENTSIDRVTLPQNGYVVLHGPSFDPENVTPDSIIGRTQYVRSGSFANVSVGINESRIEGVNASASGPSTITVYVVPHNDTDGDGEFDASGNGSFDAPFTNASGGVAFDSANITISETGTVTDTAGPTERGNKNGTVTETDTERTPGENRTGETTATPSSKIIGGTTTSTSNTTPSDGGNPSDTAGRILGVAIGGMMSNVLLGFSVLLLLILGTLTARKM